MTSEEVFSRFVPKPAVNYCVKLYQNLGFEFKVKKARQTKMGDYRFNPGTDKHTITVNNDLNQYAFLVTYLHEVAHLIAFKKFGRSILPHGSEWKLSFSEVSKPLLNEEVFPKNILNALVKYFKNPKASSCSDPVLYQILKDYDGPSETILLKEIQIGRSFVFNKKIYVKLETKRTRSICQEVVTHKKYMISEIAEVFPRNEEET